MMQQMLLGLGAGPSDVFWISEADKGSWGDEYTEDIAGDSDGNIYVVATRYNSGGNGYKGNSIVKYAADGTVTWQKVEYKTSSPWPMEVRCIGAEASGDHIYYSGQSDTGLYVIKSNKSDGSVDWRRKIDSSNSNNLPSSVVVGSDGNPIILARMDSDNGRQQYVSLNANDGTHNWKTTVKRTSGNTVENHYTSHVKVDSSGNIHSLVKADTGGTPRIINAIVKHNSSGVLQSISDYYTSNTNEDQFGDISVDSSGNKYISYRYNTGSGYHKVGVMKVNSSDVIQWQKEVDSAPNQVSPEQIEITPDGSGIIMRILDNQADKKNSFIRFDTSGNVVWKRQFGISGIDVPGSIGKMRLNKNGNIIFNTNHTTGGNVYTIVAQLPADGSLTGNYTVGSRTYEWAANTTLSFTTQTAYSKQSSSIFSSETNNSTDAAYETNITVANNVLTFTKADVD